ncbi:MAG: T9SS type A sorting domain-containing protein [Chitinophagaceae bacterium]|nr:T9SS type A sorting domain-containing protein [Chitinophagaceae bacterium]
MKKLYLIVLFFMAAFTMKAQSPQTIIVDLNASSPTFNRPLAGTPPTGLSAVGTSVYYSVFAFTAPVSGSYAFTAIGSYDNFGVLYSNAFNPLSPLTNAMSASDDVIGSNYQITQNLVAGTTYYLVSTSFSNGATGTYNVTINGPFLTPLPVTLGEFTAELNESGMAKLNWNTVTEQNNAYFNIQRSTNGQDFKTIGSLTTQAVDGNSQRELNYSYIDATPASTNYYRLEQVDIDGKKSLSRTVRLDNASQLNGVSVYPSPVTRELNIRYSANSTHAVAIRISDMTGKTVLNTTFNVTKGINENHIDLSTLPAATYVLDMQYNGQTSFRQTVIKQ